MRKGQQPPWIVPDELWARIEPLLPVVRRRADHPGRRRLDDRKVLCGILFVLRAGKQRCMHIILTGRPAFRTL